jgi:hypothetical protein
MIFGLTGTMGDNRCIAGILCYINGFKGFGNRSDLIQFDQNGIGQAAFNTLSKRFRGL